MLLSLFIQMEVISVLLVINHAAKNIWGLISLSSFVNLLVGSLWKSGLAGSKGLDLENL